MYILYILHFYFNRPCKPCGLWPAQLSLSIHSRKVLQNAVASGTSNPQLGGPVIRTFQLPPPGFSHVWNDASEQRNVELIIIGIHPLGRFGQRPELSQSTGIALVRRILGKFLGVVFHSFPPRLDVPTFATRCLNDARDPRGGRWNYGRENCREFCRKWRLPRHVGSF